MHKNTIFVRKIISKERQIVGIIGSGKFGTAIANLVTHNCSVILFTRNKDLLNSKDKIKTINGVELSEKITITNDIGYFTQTCKIILPIIPSYSMRPFFKENARYFNASHILIHGAKGFDYNEEILSDKNEVIRKKDVFTMSEVICQETSVLRVGCISGPNLSAEIHSGQPAATLVASKFDEVIEYGVKILSGPKFHVFGSHDLLGTELAGTLKNVIAIGSGILDGMKLGKNMQSILISRGLVEMIHIGIALGAEKKAFLGTAGIGDLVATATSSKSRNYSFGQKIGKGQSLDEIQKTNEDLVEGIRTLQIMRGLGKFYKIDVPIAEMMYNVVFKGLDVQRAISFLINFPNDVDVDFL